MGDAHSDLERETKRDRAYTNFFIAFLLLKKDDSESHSKMIEVLDDGECFYHLHYNPYFKKEREFGDSDSTRMLMKLIEIRENLESDKDALKTFLISMTFNPLLGEAEEERLRLWKIVKSA